MNGNNWNVGSRRLVRLCAQILICLSPTAVFAMIPEVTQRFDSVETAVIASPLHPGINVKVVASVKSDSVARGSVDAVIVPGEKTRRLRLTPAVFKPSDRDDVRTGGTSDSQQRVGGSSGGGQLAFPERDDTRQMPYSLVLTLIALIGLVQVSRRNH